MAMTPLDVPKGQGRKRRWLIALAVVLVLAAGGGWIWHKEGRGYYVPNKINRYNLAAWMPLQFNADGSLDIRTDSPGADKEANWLPAPAGGPFNLVIRNFWPKESARDGTYKVSPTRKVQ